MPRRLVFLNSLLYLLVTILTAIAVADGPSKHLMPLPPQVQGDWEVKSITLDGKPLRDDAWFPPGLPASTWVSHGVRISGLYAWSRDKTKKQAQEECQTYIIAVSQENPKHIGVLRAGPNDEAPSILVGYLAGVYKQEGNALELCLSYTGQGLEGDAADRWTWPSEFDVEEDEGHYHVRVESTRSTGASDAPKEVDRD